MAVAAHRLRKIDRANCNSKGRRAGWNLRLVIEIGRRRPLREELARFRIDRLRIPTIALVLLENVPPVETRELLPPWHNPIILTQALHSSLG